MFSYFIRKGGNEGYTLFLRHPNAREQNKSSLKIGASFH
jgi:hypothetical protein